jgi:hypothetical protein
MGDDSDDSTAMKLIYTVYFANIRGLAGGSISYGDGLLFFSCENVVIDGNSLSAAPGRTPRFVHPNLPSFPFLSLSLSFPSHVVLNVRPVRQWQTSLIYSTNFPLPLPLPQIMVTSAIL